MNPLVLGGGALLLGWLGKSYIDKSKAEARQKQLLGARELIQGRTYTVQASVDTSKLGTKDPSTAAAVIKATFQELGFIINSTPTPKTAGDQAALSYGGASQWMFQGQWNRAEKFMPQGPAWLGQAAAYEAPIMAK